MSEEIDEWIVRRIRGNSMQSEKPPSGKPSNPYHSGKMLRDPEMFFGRVDILRHLYEIIRDRQCLALVGPRRIGKSSLLFALRSHLRAPDFDLSNYLLTYIDIGELNPQTYEEFLMLICEQLIAQHPQQFAGQSPPEECDTTDFRHFLEELHDRELHPVLLLDEFERVAGAKQFTEDFFFFLRALANADKISYITASQNTLDSISHKGLLGSPFFNIFETYRLGPLTAEEATDLIMIPSRCHGVPFTEDEAKWVLLLAGRHPFYLQRTCAALFEARRDGKVNTRRIKDQVYEQLLSHFRHAWQSLDKEQQASLAWEARLPGGHHRSLPAYSESELFRNFVRREQSTKLDEITEQSITSALNNLEDIQALGKSALGQLYLIYQQYKQLPSLPERGLAVKKLLMASIEELRPRSQLRQDQNDSYDRGYQILVLQYKHKLRNGEIAARLAISPRHIIRLRNEAIKTLLSIILQKEQHAKKEDDNNNTNIE
jgi:AAA+ ATPase superfamily predicted ATPase